MVVQPELGLVVRELRGEKGFPSQESLANAAGVAVATVQRLESGENIHTTKLADIASALGVDTSFLNNRALELRSMAASAASAEIRSNVAQYVPPTIQSSAEKWDDFFDFIDDRVKVEFGDLFAPTSQMDEQFSAEKLYSSLSELDIPPSIVAHILANLPSALAQCIRDSEFSTGHIRLAVSQVISELKFEEFGGSRRSNAARARNEATVEARRAWEEKKNKWAKRYSRRYGDPKQIIMVFEKDGTQTPLDYQFLKSELIPHVFRRSIGEQFHSPDHLRIPSSELTEMAERLLDVVKKLDVHAINYKSLLYLAEDIAIQPPNTWFVTPASRESVIKYHLNRTKTHLDAISIPSNDVRHHYYEVAHHACAAILAVYGGVMGSRYHSSLSMLQTWLKLPDRNAALWSFCELRCLENDLRSLKISKSDFLRMLKKIDMDLKAREAGLASDIHSISDQLTQYVKLIYARREKMRQLQSKVLGGHAIDVFDLVATCRETISAVFGTSKFRDVLNAGRNQRIGFSAALDLEQTPFSHFSSICVLSVYDELDDESSMDDLLKDTLEHLRNHKLAQVGFVLFRSKDSASTCTKLKTKALEHTLGESLYFVPLESLSDITVRRDAKREFFDLVLEHNDCA